MSEQRSVQKESQHNPILGDVILSCLHGSDDVPSVVIGRCSTYHRSATSASMKTTVDKQSSALTDKLGRQRLSNSQSASQLFGQAQA